MFSNKSEHTNLTAPEQFAIRTGRFRDSDAKVVVMTRPAQRQAASTRFDRNGVPDSRSGDGLGRSEDEKSSKLINLLFSTEVRPSVRGALRSGKDVTMDYRY
ncbi:hypothetical protein NOR_03935 [Metarhizium rileyi]|uniref:Uncharacterized protein n=1 Tax=Metarhizium rileyi (strain RCEF 4871) TaxID=1649241 RepID=A0A162J4X4_METRR|nr:hypothetical protein NOR_03935 [Metarhizium rileyi RCEF 4871]